MEIQESWVYKLKHLYMPLDETSFVFKNELKKLKLEQEQPTPIKYNPNLFHSFVPDLVQEKVKVCYSFIDTRIYKETYNLLKKASIESSIDAICSLLKQAYYKNILIRINPGYKKSRAEFEEFFKMFIRHFEQKGTSQEYTSLKLKSNDRGKWFTINDDWLINVILTEFKEKICKDDFTAILLTDIEEGSNIFNNISPLLIPELTFNLVLYIQTKTDFIDKTSIKDILEKQKFSNKILDLVYWLICSTNLINDKKNESNPKDYIRTKLKWYIKKHLGNLALFKKIPLFPEADYFNKIIANQNRLRQLLYSSPLK